LLPRIHNIPAEGVHVAVLNAQANLQRTA
jgi:hypothetical protein